jgi:hypothetical protein
LDDRSGSIAALEVCFPVSFLSGHVNVAQGIVLSTNLPEPFCVERESAILGGMPAGVCIKRDA